MATTKQRQAARRNVKQAQAGARSKRSIAHMPKATRTALGKQGAAEGPSKRARGSAPEKEAGARSKRSIAHMPKATRTALGKQGAAVAQRKRTGASTPKTRAELYELAKKRDLPGRSRMGRDELARALHQK